MWLALLKNLSLFGWYCRNKRITRPNAIWTRFIKSKQVDWRSHHHGRGFACIFAHFFSDVFDILSLSPSNHYRIYFKSYKAQRTYGMRIIGRPLSGGGPSQRVLLRPMDYCRSTGSLTIFDGLLTMSTGLSESLKKASPVAPPGIGVLRCFSRRFSRRFGGWISMRNTGNEWWIRSWFDKSLNVLRTSCKVVGMGFIIHALILYRNDTVINIHLSDKSLEMKPLEAGHRSFLSFAASLAWISRLSSYWLFL